MPLVLAAGERRLLERMRWNEKHRKRLAVYWLLIALANLTLGVWVMNSLQKELLGLGKMAAGGTRFNFEGSATWILFLTYMLVPPSMGLVAGAMNFMLVWWR